MVCHSVFLTGATGVLGAHLVKELLNSTDCKIFCLVRAAGASEAKTRLKSFLSVYDPEGLLETAFQQRVHAIPGEISEPRFGLSECDYRRLVEQTDVTLHAAAITNLFLNYRRIAPVNVVGTRNIIEFALQTDRKELCYVSTYTVMGSRVFDPDFTFRETDYDVGQTFKYMTYQQTKFEAEAMVRDAAHKGLKWVITRPGQIFGESTTGYYPQGHSNVQGLFYDIFKTVIETRVAFQSDTHFDVVPVDYVSRAIVELGLKAPRFFETYHLTNPDITTYGEVIALLNEVGYEIQSVSQARYKEMLFDRSLQKDGLEYKSPTTSAFKYWLKRDPFNFERSAITLCDHTTRVLGERGLVCPKVDTSLIRIYIDEGVRKNVFPPVPRTKDSRIARESLRELEPSL